VAFMRVLLVPASVTALEERLVEQLVDQLVR
jgi:hypothetical protein